MMEIIMDSYSLDDVAFTAGTTTTGFTKSPTVKELLMGMEGLEI